MGHIHAISMQVYRFPGKSWSAVRQAVISATWADRSPTGRFHTFPPETITALPLGEASVKTAQAEGMGDPLILGGL